MRRRRDAAPFGLSFLDAIACGFGAVLLLLVITKVTQPILLQEATDTLTTKVEELRDRLAALRSQVDAVDARLEDSRDEISRRRGELARLTDMLADMSGQFKLSDKDSTVANILQQRLEFARGALSRDIDELESYTATPSSLVGGIPADSEYIIFIIDTSGSMFSFAWPLVLQKVSETLAVYPQVKGIQVMNDNGEYMFPRYRGRWIPDSNARRMAIIEKLRTWTVFSNSSPVQGITRAISTFYSPDKKIGLYVFGDEFTGGAIQPVLDAINKVNRRDVDGERLVRIHAIGFPVMLEPNPRGPATGEAFATLMRLVCAEHGGTFVGLPATH